MVKEVILPARRPPYARGHYYHIYNRGAHKLSIFREETNYHFVLRKMKVYSKSLSLTLISYCLLPNHYHFLVRQDGESAAGLLPQRVFNSYSKAYNKRYNHSGTLFEGSYKVILVENESYLLHLCRYIHANPVVHGLTADIASWPYSNYLEWIGERDGALLDQEFIVEHFRSAQGYREFVIEYLKQRKLPRELESYLEELER